MYLRLARYRYRGDPRELSRRVQSGLLPIFESQPGFRSYSVAADGDEVISLTAWDEAGQAEAANEAAAGWVAENMSEVELVEARILELYLSTIFGLNP